MGRTNLNFAWIRLSQLYLIKTSARGVANEELRRDIMRALSEHKEKFIDVLKKPMVWLILAIFLGLSIGLIATHNQLSSVRKELVTCQKMNPNGCHGSFRGKFPFKMPAASDRVAKVSNRTSQMSEEMQKEVLDIARLALLKSKNNDNDIARYIQQELTKEYEGFWQVIVSGGSPGCGWAVEAKQNHSIHFQLGSKSIMAYKCPTQK